MVAETNWKITGTLELRDKMSDQLRKSSKTFTAEMQKMGKLTRVTRTETQTYNKHGKMMTDQVKKSTKAVAENTKGMKKNAVALLGIMFFAQSVKKTIASMLQPAMEATGIFDLWNTLLLVTFLPIMLLLLPILISMMEWFMGLPEPVKVVIGVIAVLGFVLAALISLLISIALAGAGAALLGIGEAGATAAGASGLGALVGILKVLGGLLAVGIGLKIAWDTVSADQSTLVEKLKGSLAAGVAVGIGALIFGAGGWAALGIGILTTGIVLSLAFEVEAMKTESLTSFLAYTGLAAGIIAGLAALILGAPFWPVALGVLLLSFIVKLSFFPDKDAQAKQKELSSMGDFSLEPGKKVPMLDPAAFQIPPDIQANINAMVSGTKSTLATGSKDWNATVLTGMDQLKTNVTVKNKEVSTNFFNTTTDVNTTLVTGSALWNTSMDTGMKTVVSTADSYNQTLIDNAWATAAEMSAAYASVSGPSDNSSGDGSGSGGGTDNHDFIWRAGQGAESIDSNDTVVGVKNGLGGLGGGVTLNITYNVQVSDKAAMQKSFEENNRRLVDDIKRMVKA